MTKEEPQFDNWKDAYEWHAAESSKNAETVEEDILAEAARKGLGGSYFEVWHALGSKGTAKLGGAAILEFLQNNPGEDAYLDRYHAFEALEKIVKREGIELLEEEKFGCILEHEGEEKRQKALMELRKKLQVVLG